MPAFATRARGRERGCFTFDADDGARGTDEPGRYDGDVAGA